LTKLCWPIIILFYCFVVKTTTCFNLIFNVSKLLFILLRNNIEFLKYSQIILTFGVSYTIIYSLQDSKGLRNVRYKMIDYLNKAMNCIFETLLSLDKENRPSTSEFFWFGSTFNLLKTFVYELFLIWTKTLMIFVWCTRVFVYILCLPPATVDRSVLENMIRFAVAAGLMVIIITVLVIFYAISLVSMKCVIEITIWINTLWASMLLAFGYCRLLISFVSTIVVVTRLMYLFQIAVNTIHKVFGTSMLSWLGRPGNRFTTNCIIRCCAFVYGLVWVTDTFLLLNLAGLVIVILGITKSMPSTAK